MSYNQIRRLIGYDTWKKSYVNVQDIKFGVQHVRKTNNNVIPDNNGLISIDNFEELPCLQPAFPETFFEFASVILSLKLNIKHFDIAYIGKTTGLGALEFCMHLHYYAGLYSRFYTSTKAYYLNKFNSIKPLDDADKIDMLIIDSNHVMTDKWSTWKQDNEKQVKLLEKYDIEHLFMKINLHIFSDDFCSILEKRGARPVPCLSDVNDPNVWVYLNKNNIKTDLKAFREKWLSRIEFTIDHPIMNSMLTKIKDLLPAKVEKIGKKPVIFGKYDNVKDLTVFQYQKWMDTKPNNALSSKCVNGTEWLNISDVSKRLQPASNDKIKEILLDLHLPKSAIITIISNSKKRYFNQSETFKLDQLIERESDVIVAIVGNVPVKAISNSDNIFAPIYEKETEYIFSNLKLGGTAVLKLTFPIMENKTKSIIKKMVSSFDKASFVKPLSSKISNSEVFLLCQGYNGCTNNNEIEDIVNPFIDAQIQMLKNIHYYYYHYDQIDKY